MTDKHVFRDKASLPLTYATAVVTSHTISSYWFYIILQEYQIHADSASNWSWSLLIYFHFSVGVKQSLIRYAEVKLAIKSQHSSSMRNLSVIQPFCMHCSNSSSYFFSLCWFALSIFSSKRIHDLMTQTLFELTDQFTRSGCWAVNIILACPTSWGYRMHRMHFCRGVILSKWVSWVWQ